MTAIKVTLAELKHGDVFTTNNRSDVPYGAAVGAIKESPFFDDIKVIDINGFMMLSSHADRVVEVDRP